MIERYFDNAATTPVDPRVREEMLPFLGEAFGNANSLHEPGRRARAAVELARERVARLLGAEDPSQIVFVSGATEANNWILNAFPKAAISPFEHSSLFDTARALGRAVLPNEGLKLLGPPWPVDLVSVMAVNNEIGARWDASKHRHPGASLHSDITQAAGKLPVSVAPLDFASLSGHKFHGPKGIGALYSRESPPPPMLLGGEQEGGFRAGTLNVPAIVGMGAAAQIALDEMDNDLQTAQACRAAVLGALEGCTEMRVNGGESPSPYILSLSFRGVVGETLVIEADQAGFAISSGAACSSRSTEPSHVMTALGIEPDWLKGTVRISFGRYNKESSSSELGLSLRRSVERLRAMRAS
ncbi:MAG: cysteine desulfurase [Fimbriimonas ginsengisoli]|uniref:cysteine desulfurase n=1 Tax=Fimbriimonas ginsengisoli TaxID=1005039 RepID=A0A931LWY5_FIMGI|nr:cysteine desulfurase [Fimbriimonas ginsengisoli]